MRAISLYSTYKIALIFLKYKFQLLEMCVIHNSLLSKQKVDLPLSIFTTTYKTSYEHLNCHSIFHQPFQNFI